MTEKESDDYLRKIYDILPAVLYDSEFAERHPKEYQEAGQLWDWLRIDRPDWFK